MSAGRRRHFYCTVRNEKTEEVYPIFRCHFSLESNLSKKLSLHIELGIWLFHVYEKEISYYIFRFNSSCTIICSACSINVRTNEMKWISNMIGYYCYVQSVRGWLRERYITSEHGQIRTRDGLFKKAEWWKHGNRLGNRIPFSILNLVIGGMLTERTVLEFGVRKAPLVGLCRRFIHSPWRILT